jgi:hypothetical protein
MSNIPDNNSSHNLGVLTKEFRRTAKTIINLYGLPYMGTQVVAWMDPDIGTTYQLSSMQEPGAKRGSNIIQLYTTITYPDNQVSETAYVTYEGKIGCGIYYVKMTREQKIAKDLMRSRSANGVFENPDYIDPSLEMDLMTDLIVSFMKSPNNLIL